MGMGGDVWFYKNKKEYKKGTSHILSIWLDHGVWDALTDDFEWELVDYNLYASFSKDNLKSMIKELQSKYPNKERTEVDKRKILDMVRLLKHANTVKAEYLKVWGSI